MSLRNRAGNWHYRFYAAGRTWTGDTGLAATERNRSAALMSEMEARKAICQGRAEQLKTQVKPFSDAADQFIEWAKGEHREKPATWKRLRVSMRSLKVFFGASTAPHDHRGSGSGLHVLAPRLSGLQGRRMRGLRSDRAGRQGNHCPARSTRAVATIPVRHGAQLVRVESGRAREGAE